MNTNKVHDDYEDETASLKIVDFGDRLALRSSDGMDNWYVIEKQVHDGREWMERTPWGGSFMTSARITNADIEGMAGEMRAIAMAIDTGSKVSFKRCAVVVNVGTAEPDHALLWSPRNSRTIARVPLWIARDLACKIVDKLGLR